MKHFLLFLLLVVTACNSISLFGFNGFGPKKPKPVAGRVTVNLQINQLNSRALDKNCLYYAIGDEPLRQYGCNHETKPLPITREVAPSDCIKVELELRSYLPQDTNSCISLIREESEARCDYESEPFQVIKVGKSNRVKIIKSSDDRTKTFTFEDSKDNDFDDYVFSLSSNAKLCP